MGGDSQAKEQRGASWGQLNQLFGTSTAAASDLGATGKAEKAKGFGTLDDVTSYLNTLFRGNRQATAEAVAPAANAATAAADATKKEQATMGTGRTGGGVAQNQQIADKTRAEIDTLISRVKPEAAAGLTGIGEFEAGLGMQDISNMLSALGIGVSASGTSGGQATQAQAEAQKAQAAMWSAIISGAADVASAGVAKCWIAEAIWGVKDIRTVLVRAWFTVWYEKTKTGSVVMWAYGKFGRRVARWPWAVRLLRPLFSVAFIKAVRYFRDHPITIEMKEA